MSVNSVQLVTIGQVPNSSGLGIGMTQQSPTIAYINTSDTLNTVLTTGYLNKSRATYGYAYNNKQMALVYTTDLGDVWLTISVSGTNYSLVSTSAAGEVALPTVVGQIASATNLNGALNASGIATIFNLGNIAAGQSGTAGALQSYPATAARGALIIQGVANAGNTNVTISNVSFGQATTMSFADPGSAAGRFLVANTATPFTANHLAVASGTGGLMADAGYQQKVVAQAAVAGGAAAQTVVDAFCTAGSMVVANWNDTTNAVTIQKVAAGAGQFVVTSSGDPGASHINYIITKV